MVAQFLCQRVEQRVYGVLVVLIGDPKDVPLAEYLTIRQKVGR